jgi:hypothetical protein
MNIALVRSTPHYLICGTLVRRNLMQLGEPLSTISKVNGQTQRWLAECDQQLLSGDVHAAFDFLERIKEQEPDNELCDQLLDIAYRSIHCQNSK